MADQVQKSPQECDTKIIPIVELSKDTKATDTAKAVDVSDDLIEESDCESEPDDWDDWDDYPDSDDACMYYRDTSGQWRCR
mgnify:CR=1 FL=1